MSRISLQNGSPPSILTAITYPDGSATTTIYDDAGRVTSSAERNASGVLYSTVKREIDNGHPVLLHYESVHSPADGHWVVAYKYINACETDEDIYVCDPAFTYDELYGTSRVYYSGHDDLSNKVYNNGITIKSAKDQTSITNFIEFRLTSPVSNINGT